MSQSEFSILNHLFDTLPSGLLIFRLDGTIVRINQRARELLSIESLDIVQIQEFPAYLQPLKTLLLKGKESLQRAELVLNFPERPEPTILGYNLKRIHDVEQNTNEEKSVIFTLTFSDITQVVQDRRTLDRIQDELQQSKKLASLGTLVAGVAHELNNPLTGISMSVSLMKMNLDRLKQQPAVQAEEKLSSHLDKAILEIEKILRANEKAAILVNDLLAYSKPSQLFLEPLPTAGLIQDFVGALRNHPQFSQVQFQVENIGAYSVLCDRVKLEQVFYNLFKNASDAMDHQGTITLSVSETQLQQKPAISVHVKDTGRGMDASTLNRIFDPFFTTKGHNGVGLGLSVSYRTLEQHGGLLSVESTLGLGSEFKVTLPVYLEKPDLSG